LTYPSDATAASLVRQVAARVPDRPAIVSVTGEQITYAQLVVDSDRLGSALLGLGLAPGDRVAAWMEDSTDYVLLYVACSFAGLVVVPINARLTAHEATIILEDAEPRVLVFSSNLVERVDSLARNLAGVTLVCSDAPVTAHTFAALLSVGSKEPLPARTVDELYMIGYTSGTTGRPKGAMLTQGSVATLAHMNALSYRLVPGSIAAMTGSMSFVAVVPSHIFSHFSVGGTVCFLGKWTVDSLLDAVERLQATFTYLPSPVLAEFAAKAATRPDEWSSLVTVLHSASKAPVAKLRLVADVIGDRLFEGWGMTENSGGLATATRVGDAQPPRGGADRLGSIGKPVEGVEVRVVDLDGCDVPADGESVGELIFRSPSLMVGYWRNPVATAAALRDGWYHSGDLGSIDSDGYLWLHERRSDLIVSGGMNVYPLEVEEVIARVPGVLACAVVGLPDERWGQAVTAAVVVEPGLTVTEEQVLDTCRTYLAGYKKPRRVAFVSELPMTASLKVSRSRVREALLSD
jgi:acyl-CoA synthetase (AMP-forming)/AMP-acid ligase II